MSDPRPTGLAHLTDDELREFMARAERVLRDARRERNRRARRRRNEK